jgi:hypothetical protein
MINGAYVSDLMAQPADLRGDLADAAMKLLAKWLAGVAACDPVSPARNVPDRQKAGAGSLED